MRRPGATIIKSSRWPLKDGHRKIQLWIKGTSHAMFPTSSDVLWLYWLYWNISNGDFCCNESLKWIPILKHLWLQKRYQLQISELWVLEIKHGGETWLHPRWHARNWSKQKTASVSDNPRQADKHTISICQCQYTLCSSFLHGFKWLYIVKGIRKPRIETPFSRVKTKNCSTTIPFVEMTVIVLHIARFSLQTLPKQHASPPPLLNLWTGLDTQFLNFHLSYGDSENGVEAQTHGKLGQIDIANIVWQHDIDSDSDIRKYMKIPYRSRWP